MPPRPLVVLILFMLCPLISFGQWEPKSSPTTFEINDILFLTENIGFLGTDNTVYKTIDGGQTWTSPQYPGGTTDFELLTTSYIHDIHFFDQSNGLMVGSGFYNGFNIIARTTDGGSTWRLVYNQPVTGEIITRTPLTSVAFKDGNVGYAVGGDGIILRTSNSGESWTPITSPTPNNLRKVLFLDAQTGFIAGDDVLFKTTDGGTTWLPISMALEISDLHFFTASSGIATTAEGRILNTTDGGLNWVEHSIDFEAKLGKIVFSNQTGYVVGSEGLFNRFILKTTNGGLVWEHQFPNATYNLTGITLTPGGKGWVGGTYGKLFSTTNGGGNSYPIAAFTGATAFCANKTFTFTNHGPENKYAYEWRVDGVLKSTSYNFSTTFTEGNHTVELRAINGLLTGAKQRSFYVEGAVGFTKPLELTVTGGICQGSSTPITVKDPEYGRYKLYDGTTLIAEDNDYAFGIAFQTPELQSSKTFRVTATRSNSCESVEISKDVTVNVYSDLTQGSSISLVQDYFCNSGVPAVQVTSSRSYVKYELFSGDKLLSSAVGNGQTIALSAPEIQDTTQYKVKASIANGLCERWFNDILEVKVERVEARFGLPLLNAAIGESVNVYNKSAGANTFQWTFPGASPASSNVRSPGPVAFNQAGTHQVTLTARSSSGCQHTESKSIYVYDDSSLDLSCWATGIGFDVEGGTVTEQFLEGLTAAPNGDVLTTGYYLGEAEFDSKAGPNFKTKNEVFITNFLARYSAKGVLKWMLNTSRYMVENSTNPMMGSKAVTGSDGSIYLLTNYGSFEPVFYSADGDSLQPYKDVFIYPSSQQYLIKYSGDGILQWVKSKFEITGDMLSTHFINLEVDAMGNLYVVNKDLYKISSADGDVLSAVQAFDPQQVNAHLESVDFKLAPDGSFYTIGRGVNQYIKIKRYTGAGTLEWENNITSTYIPYGGSSVTPDGGLVLFGTSSVTTEFESEGESDRVVDPKSLFIVSYDVNGKIVWLNTALTNDKIWCTSIATNEAGETSVAVQGTAQFGNILQSQDNFNFTFNTKESPHIVRYDAHGNIIGTNKIFGEEMHFYFNYQLFSLQDQTYLKGWLYNNDVPATVNGDVIYDQNRHSMFIAKFQNDCPASSAPSITGYVVDIQQGGSICPGTIFNVSYDVEPGIQLEADNEFSVFLVPENASGIVKAGSMTSTDLQGTILARVPDDIPFGNTYKIRIFASNPKLYSEVIDHEFTIRSVEPPDFIFTETMDLTYRLMPAPTVSQGVECKWLVEGKTIEERTPLYKFSTTGLFEVCMIAKDECGVERTVCKNIYVQCSSVPTDFTYSVNEKTLTFTGITNSSNTFEWDFRDGITATTMNAVHTFATYGTKSVCFTSHSECNLGRSCKSITLTCTQGSLGFTSVSAEKTVQFTNTSGVDYTQFEWKFGDGTTSTEKNPVHTYPEPGSYYVTLTSTGKCSEVKTLAQIVTVQCVMPAADFQTSVDELEVAFDNRSLNAGQHHWTFGDGTTSDMNSPKHTYSSPGNYQVCLKAINGCTQKTICKSVVVTYYIPDSPTGLVATTLDRSNISLSWVDNATKEQSYWLLFSESNGSFKTLATLPANTTNYIASNLMCDRFYTFRVVAMGQANIATTADADASATTQGLEKPIVTATAFEACAGEFIELTAPDGFSYYAWSTGQTTQKITVTNSGQYAVSVIDNTCQSPLSEKTFITIHPLPDTFVEVVDNKISARSFVEYYQWHLNDIPMEATNTRELTPTVSGNYKVKLTNYGCSSISENIAFVITGLEESLAHQINFYPLPADETLTIVFDDIYLEGNAAEISLVSATGTNSLNARKSPNENKVELNISRLPAGMYVCVIKVGEKVIHKKVVIH